MLQHFVVIVTSLHSCDAMRCFWWNALRIRNSNVCTLSHSYWQKNRTNRQHTYHSTNAMMRNVINFGLDNRPNHSYQFLAKKLRRIRMDMKEREQQTNQKKNCIENVGTTKLIHTLASIRHISNVCRTESLAETSAHSTTWTETQDTHRRCIRTAIINSDQLHLFQKQIVKMCSIRSVCIVTIRYTSCRSEKSICEQSVLEEYVMTKTKSINFCLNIFAPLFRRWMSWFSFCFLHIWPATSTLNHI